MNCDAFFDFDSLDRFVEFDKPLYSIVEKRRTAKLLTLSPKQYIYRIAQGFGGLTWEDVVESSVVSKENIEKYARDMLCGDKFPIPYYTRGGDYQEGRHRSLAAMSIGCDEIPVIEFINITDSEYNNMLKKFKGMSYEELDELFKKLGYKNGITMLGYNSLSRRYELDNINEVFMDKSLNEYINSDELSFKKYLEQSDEDKMKSLPYEFGHLLSGFLEEKGVSLEDSERYEHEIEILEKEHPEIYEEFSKWLLDGVKNYSLPILDADYPAWSFFDDSPEIVKNQWMIHFTDEADSIAIEGFKYGVDEFSKLGLTTMLGDVDKEYGGFNFAYLIDDFNRYATSRGQGYKYGSEAVVFRASGIKTWHYSDEEPQVVFFGNTATNIIPITRGEDSEWAVRDVKSWDVLYEDDDLQKVVFWIANNYDQYRKRLHEVRKFVRKVLVEMNEALDSKSEMVLYHGSPYLFKEFKPRNTFFSDTEDFAVDYADQKSFEGGLDAEPKLYKVKVNTNLFDINDPDDYAILASRLPETVKYAYNNFGFTTELPKQDMLLALKGFDKIEPYEPAVKAKVGDEIPDPHYAPEKFVVVKKDDNNAYAYAKKDYDRLVNNLTTEPLNLRGYYPDDYRDLVKNFNKKVMEIAGWMSGSQLKGVVLDAVQDKGFKYSDVPNDKLKEIERLYNEAVKRVEDIMVNGKLKKFPIQSSIVEVGDTWRFYENEDVSELIRNMGYGGYVAKEKGVNTYLIFNPKDDVEIIEYEIPHGTSFSSWDDFLRYREYNKNIAERLPEKTYLNNSYVLYKMYKNGMTTDEAWAEINSNKEKYLHTLSW